MIAKEKLRFFDGIADQWDDWEDLDAVGASLDRGLRELGLRPGEVVLDVGCGTGNLTRAILGRLSEAGRVVAIDISPEMVRRARQKIDDPRARFLVTEASRIPVPDSTFDRVLCFSVWPHIDDLDAAVAELVRTLRPGGLLHVWHLASRQTINRIHADADEAVREDVLRPASETARVLQAHGLHPFEVVDEDTRYLVSASRGPAPG